MLLHFFRLFRILTPYEAKSLVALLHAKDVKTLERALVTISNASAFTQNQNSLHEAGCLVRLQRLIIHSDRSVKLKAQQAVANLALNETNQKDMEVRKKQMLTLEFLHN